MAQTPERPSVAVGHIILRVSEVTRAADFYKSLGLRPVFERGEMAILELRGGTHLLLFKAKSRPKSRAVRSFDFMVDDADEFHDDLARRGVRTNRVREDAISGHRMFELTDPDGHVITVLSDHTEGRPV
jgi:catechol 2,3-dioxygenase-like lactoylglutathione lyase family enzyme